MPPPVVVVPPVPVVGNIVTTVPDSTYTGEDLIAFNLLNAERSYCGFGKLAQHPKLDLAAKAHADWGMTNYAFTHTENQATYPQGFTGVTSDDRAAFQGYDNAGDVAEAYNSRTGLEDKTGWGVKHTRGLLAAPFHLRGLMDGWRDVGLAMRSTVDAPMILGGKVVWLNINPAYKAAAGKQLQDSTAVLTYPCEGSTGMNYALRGENPNPVPGRNLAALPLGHPVLIKVRDGNTLVVSSASMTNSATSEPVLLRSAAQTKLDDTTNNFYRNSPASEAYVIPDVPLLPSTQYQVVITGTNNGAAFSRTFSFTTGTFGAIGD